MDYIAELRKHEGASSDDVRNSDIFEEIESLLYRAKSFEVDSTFKMGGRWFNTLTKVYEVNTIDEQAFFEIWRELPATELQEADEYRWEFREVYPQEVTTTIYAGTKYE